MIDKNNKVFAIAIEKPVKIAAIVSIFFQDMYNSSTSNKLYGMNMRCLDLFSQIETEDERTFIYNQQKHFIDNESRLRTGGFFNLNYII